MTDAQPAAPAASAIMNSEAIDYVKKPTEEFISDSWRLLKRCTKPDRQGARRWRRVRNRLLPLRLVSWMDTARRLICVACLPAAAANDPDSNSAAAPPISGAAAQEHSVQRSTAASPQRCAQHGCSARGTRARLTSDCVCAAACPDTRVPAPPRRRRVHKDRAGDCERLCDHGLHRVLCEAHLHPDQQHCTRTARGAAARPRRSEPVARSAARPRPLLLLLRLVAALPALARSHASVHLRAQIVGMS